MRRLSYCESRNTFETHKNEIKNLYEQGNSCASVSSLLSKEGIQLSPSALASFLGKEGWLRSNADAAKCRTKYPDIFCKACQKQTTPRSPTQKCCLECAPNKLAYYRFKSYGITEKQFNEMILSQGGCCAICDQSFSSLPAKDTCIDHCHKTGRIRGILCNRCNTGIAIFKDDIQILTRASFYLRD